MLPVTEGEWGHILCRHLVCRRVPAGAVGVREKEARTRNVKGNMQANLLGIHSLTKILNFLLQPSCRAVKATTGHSVKHQKKTGHQEQHLGRLQS